MDDFDLERFVQAQEGGSFHDARAELRAGRKTSHWMWWIFPQIAGLGLSSTSRRYAISGLDEARAYLAHPVLGARLRECAQVLLDLDNGDPGNGDPVRVMGSIDATKLRSSMTLFSLAAPEETVFSAVLAAFYGGTSDEATLRELHR